MEERKTFLPKEKEKGGKLRGKNKGETPSKRRRKKRNLLKGGEGLPNDGRTKGKKRELCLWEY